MVVLSSEHVDAPPLSPVFPPPVPTAPPVLEAPPLPLAPPLPIEPSDTPPVLASTEASPAPLPLIFQSLSSAGHPVSAKDTVSTTGSHVRIQNLPAIPANAGPSRAVMVLDAVGEAAFIALACLCFGFDRRELREQSRASLSVFKSA